MAKNTSSSEFLFDPMNDAAFKSLVRAEETREFMVGVLADLTHIPINILNTSEFIGGELPKEILTQKQNHY